MLNYQQATARNQATFSLAKKNPYLSRVLYDW